MKILVESLGGTIGSHIGGDGIVRLGADGESTRGLFDCASGCELVFASPIKYSSENATCEDYRVALKGIRDDVLKHEPDGVLVLHGTDTMAFLAQLAARCLAYLKRPLIITGSKLPISEGHDAAANVAYAIELLKAGADVIGVVYTSSVSGEQVLLDASKITSPDIAGDYGSYDDAKAVIQSAADLANSTYELLSKRFLDSPTTEGVLVIPAFPGYPYSQINCSGVSRILIECHHSGTADSKRLVPLIRKWREQGEACYIAPMPCDGNVYESRSELLDAGAVPLVGMPIEGAWAEAVIR